MGRKTKIQKGPTEEQLARIAVEIPVNPEFLHPSTPTTQFTAPIFNTPQDQINSSSIGCPPGVNHHFSIFSHTWVPNTPILSHDQAAGPAQEVLPTPIQSDNDELEAGAFQEQISDAAQEEVLHTPIQSDDDELELSTPQHQITTGVIPVCPGVSHSYNPSINTWVYNYPAASQQLLLPTHSGILPSLLLNDPEDQIPSTAVAAAGINQYNDVHSPLIAIIDCCVTGGHVYNLEHSPTN